MLPGMKVGMVSARSAVICIQECCDVMLPGVKLGMVSAVICLSHWQCNASGWVWQLFTSGNVRGDVMLESGRDLRSIVRH